MNSNSWSVHQLFGLLDQNQDGYIDVHDMKAVSHLLPNESVVIMYMRDWIDRSA